MLTGNLTPPPGTGALVVGPPNVDIDLNGFTITGAGGPGGDGIFVGPALGVTIHDGVITGFGGPGIAAAPGPELKVFKLRVGGNGAGITGGFDCLIVDNTIVGNAGFGVDARRCKIENNVISDNGDTGITGDTNVIVHNVIAMNGFGLGGGGGNGDITVGPGSAVNDNSVSFNIGIGAGLAITAGYTNNTFNANTIQDVSLFVPAAPAPHPTSGFFNLCTGVPGPAPVACPRGRERRSPHSSSPPRAHPPGTR